MLTLKKKASGKSLVFAYLEFRGQKPEFGGSNKLGLVTRLCTPIKDPSDAVMIKGRGRRVPQQSHIGQRTG